MAKLIFVNLPVADIDHPLHVERHVAVRLHALAAGGAVIATAILLHHALTAPLI